MLDKVCSILAKISMFMAASCTGVLAVIMFLQIFFRMVINSPLSWADEISGYVLVWITMYGAVAALYEKRHLAITAVLDRLSGKVLAIMKIVVNILILIFLGFLFYYSIPLITKLGSMTANALPIPLTLIYSPMAITACFSIVIVISDVLDEIKKNWCKKGGVEQ